MTVATKVLVPIKFLEAVQTMQYQATNVTGIIDKCTVTNITAGAITLTMNIVNGGDVAATSNTVISARSIAAGETYLCAEMIGQVIRNGDYISAVAGTTPSLVMRISGRELD